jgi:hypothetical protein
MGAQWTSPKWNDKKEAVDNWPLSLRVEQNGVVTRMLRKDCVVLSNSDGSKLAYSRRWLLRILSVEGGWQKQTLILTFFTLAKPEDDCAAHCMPLIWWLNCDPRFGKGLFWLLIVLYGHQWNDKKDASLQPSPHRSKLALRGNWFLRSSSMDDASSAKGSFWFSDLIGPILMPINGKLSEWRAVTSVAKIFIGFQERNSNRSKLS